MNAIPMAELQQAAIALVLSLSLGLVCRLFNLPLPAPPTFIGVLMIAGLALGYAVGGFWR